MKNLRTTLLLLSVVVVLFAACRKSGPKQIKYIPKSASVIFATNAKKLSDKLEDSKVSVDSLLKSILTSTGMVPSEVEKWNSMKDAGIDWQSDVFGFVDVKSSIMSGSSTAYGVVAAVSSTSKLEDFLKKQKPGLEVKKATGGYSEVALQDGVLLGWNNDVCIIAGVKGASAAGKENASAQLATLFTLKEDESAASVEKFKEFAKTKADAFLWTNSEGSFNSASPLMGMSKAGDLMADSYNGIEINFENGKVKADVTSYSGKALTDLVKKYPSENVDLNLVTVYPSDNITGFIAVNINPGLIVEILHYAGLDALANNLLKELGFTIEDVLKSFKGDVAFVYSDLAVTEKTDFGVTHKATGGKFIVAAKVGDKASYTKVLGALASKNYLVQQGAVYTVASPVAGTQAITFEPGGIYYASDATLLEQYKSGKSKAAVPEKVLSEGKGKSILLYADLDKIFAGSPVNDSISQLEVNQAKVTFKQIFFVGDNYSSGKGKAYGELVTGNDKENSLATILKFAKEVSALENGPGRHKYDFDAAADAVDSTDVVADTAFAPNKPIK